MWMVASQRYCAQHKKFGTEGNSTPIPSSFRSLQFSESLLHFYPNASKNQLFWFECCSLWVIIKHEQLHAVHWVKGFKWSQLRVKKKQTIKETYTKIEWEKINRLKVDISKNLGLIDYYNWREDLSTKIKEEALFHLGPHELERVSIMNRKLSV